MLRDHLEDLCMVGTDRHDHGAVHMARGRQETLRSAERPAARLEACNLDPRAVLQNLHLRQVRSVHLQVQRALVRLEPKFLAELIPVAFLLHVEGTLAKPARQGSGNRERAWRGRLLRSEEHTSELQSQSNLACRLLLDKKLKFRARSLTSR